MIITCDKCNTRYRLKQTVKLKKTSKVKCARCGHVFLAADNLSKDTLSIEAKDSIKIDGIGDSVPGLNAKIISVCNQKGGVAKTTTSLNLAVSLSLLKKRVLVIDFDIQANLTLLMGYKDAKSFFEVIHSGESLISSYILQTRQGIWLLPSNSKMALLSKKHIQDEKFEYLLTEKLAAIKSYFDYIIIDTPPSGDFYTLNALLASDIAIIPTPAEYLAMQGVHHIVNMINVIKEKSGHTINYRIPITMYDADNTATKVVLKKIREEFGNNIFDTVIEKDQKIQESQIVNMPTIIYDRESKAGKQYYRLAQEVMKL